MLEQDSLFLGLGKGGYEAAESELQCRKDVGFKDQKLYDAEQLKSILGSEGYTAGIRYGGTYGINPLQCLQGFKDVLVDNGMQVFESTAMKRLEDHTVYTHGAASPPTTSSSPWTSSSRTSVRCPPRCFTRRHF